MSDTPQPSHDTGPGDAPAKDSAPAARRPGKRPLIILALGVLILAMWAGWHYLATGDLESTDDAQVDGNAVTMQAKVSGYVIALDVGDNQWVKSGTLLFQIDPRDYMAQLDQAQASVEQAQAQAENARASLDMTRVSAPAKLTQAQAQSASAAASLEYANSDLGRQMSVEQRSTSQQSIDQARQNMRSAKATLQNQLAQETIASLIPQTIAEAQAQYDEAVAQLAEARAQLATAQLNLSYADVRAPQDGWVTQRNIQLGSYVTAGQSALSLVSPDFWITANFKENQLSRMRVGQDVRIRIDAYPNLRLEGHVASLQMGTGSRFSAFPAENATGNFIKIVQRVPVKILVDRGSDPKTPLPLGLSAEPTVVLK